MNVGHHWHKVDSTFAKYERMMDMVLEAIAERFRGTHLVFRTSAPGYYGCETITEPVDSVQELTPAIDAYEWRKPYVGHGVVSCPLLSLNPPRSSASLCFPHHNANTLASKPNFNGPSRSRHNTRTSTRASAYSTFRSVRTVQMPMSDTRCAAARSSWTACTGARQAWSIFGTCT